MRILLVENDDICARRIAELFEANRINCRVENYGEEGLKCLEYNPTTYDALVVDLGLPGMNGNELIKRVRASCKAPHSYLPIVVISGYSTSKDKVQSLLNGADDYVTKPFDNQELVLRVLNVVRRTKGHSSHLIKVGDIQLDLTKQEITVKDNTLELTTKEYNLLQYLIMNKGNLMLKEAIITHLYSSSIRIPTRKIIDVLVCKIRSKIAVYTEENYLHTIWGRGYFIDTPAAVASKFIVATAV